MTDKVQINFGGLSGGTPASGSLTFAATPASVHAAVPAQTELLCICSTSPCHIRISTDATPVAVQSDPMVVPGYQPLVIRLDSKQSYNIAAISDANQAPVSPATNGTLSFFQVFEA